MSNRLDFHNAEHVKSTKSFLPWELIGFLEKETRSEAIILERKLKNLNIEDLKKFILKYFGIEFEIKS